MVKVFGIRMKKFLINTLKKNSICMKHKLNENLLNSLLKFDFLILDSSKIKNRTNSKSLNSSAGKAISFLLEPAEVIKSLKQVIRLLAFLAKKKNPMLYIHSKNLFLSKLLHFFANKPTDKLSLDNDFAFMRFNKNGAILSLDNYNSNNFYKHFFNKHVYLINEINAYTRLNDFGLYKVHNSLDSYKKLIFLAVLLKKAYLK